MVRELGLDRRKAELFDKFNVESQKVKSLANRQSKSHEECPNRVKISPTYHGGHTEKFV